MTEDSTITVYHVKGVDGSDAGTNDTRQAKIKTNPDHILIELPRPGVQSKDCASVWVQWKPLAGWEVTVHQAGDESSISISVPDDGESLTLSDLRQVD
jgi:hypothetical protein